jgi:RepB DNA-primase from phage plasmid
LLNTIRAEHGEGVVFKNANAGYTSQTLARRYDADLSAAGWRRFGRLPGFTNCKPKYRKPDGLFPFVRLVSHTGLRYPMAEVFHEQIIKLHEEEMQKREVRWQQASLSPQRGGRFVSLERFRTSAKYADRPAAADIAFCVCSFRQWHDRRPD